MIVLGVLLVVAVLANIILAIISSQSRLTHHQVGRIQAYYVAQAGMNRALEELRVGNWTYNATTNTCPNATGGCNITDPDFPLFIQQPVKVIFCPNATICTGVTTACSPPPGIDFCINTVVNYTFPSS